MAYLRDYRPQDEAATYDVCLKTGDAGNDATHLHEDPRALGNIYVGPYLSLEPRFALVLEDEVGVCGYCLGALDTRVFFRRFVEEWLPPLQRAFPVPIGDPAGWTRSQRMYNEYHHPDLFHPEPIADYPSHLHIDLLPRIQGQGWGKRLVTALLHRLSEHGSPGVHLGMWARNHRALEFYSKLGFHRLAEVGEGDAASLYLGLKLPPSAS